MGMAHKGRTKSLRNCEALRDVLARFVADADFLKFDEYGKHEGRPSRKDVVENASMLKEIIRIAPMLAATLACIQACMLQIATDTTSRKCLFQSARHGPSRRPSA